MMALPNTVPGHPSSVFMEVNWSRRNQESFSAVIDKPRNNLSCCDLDSVCNCVKQKLITGNEPAMTRAGDPDELVECLWWCSFCPI